MHNYWEVNCHCETVLISGFFGLRRCRGWEQCSGSELIFFGFGTTNYGIFFGFGFLRLIFWPQIFLNGASNCFHMCSGTCNSETKIFNRKTKDFSLSSVWFFTKIFILQQCLNPNPYPNPNFLRIRVRIQPKHSDYFGFGLFGSTTLVVKIMFCLPTRKCRVDCVRNFGKENFFIISKYSLSRYKFLFSTIRTQTTSRFAIVRQVVSSKQCFPKHCIYSMYTLTL
jgi:hypothetical protein